MAVNYKFLICQIVCIYQMAWRSVNTIARMLNHVSLGGAGHQHKVCEVCITNLGVALGVKMCNTGDMYVNIIRYRSISVLI